MEERFEDSSIEYLRVSSEVLGLNITRGLGLSDDVRTINRTVSLVDRSSSFDPIDGTSNV